jgi:hypothetical protein
MQLYLLIGSFIYVTGRPWLEYRSRIKSRMSKILYCVASIYFKAFISKFSTLCNILARCVIFLNLTWIKLCVTLCGNSFAVFLWYIYSSLSILMFSYRRSYFYASLNSHGSGCSTREEASSSKFYIGRGGGSGVVIYILGVCLFYLGLVWLASTYREVARSDGTIPITRAWNQKSRTTTAARGRSVCGAAR